MKRERNPDPLILWVDESEEGRQAIDLLAESGIPHRISRATAVDLKTGDRFPRLIGTPHGSMIGLPHIRIFLNAQAPTDG